MKIENSSVIFLFKLPPPVNGATNANNYLYQSELLKEYYKCYYINTGLARKSNDFGTVRFGKFVAYGKAVLKLVGILITQKINLVYITIAPVGPAFIKDSLFVFISKIFRKQIVIHLHGKGIGKKTGTSSFWFKYYRFLLRNTNVICLSDRLVSDIESVYSKAPFIVPNGVPVIDYEKVNAKDPVKPIILYLSNLYIQKGVLDFVRSIEMLQEMNNDFEAWIVGNSTVELNIKELKKIIAKRKLQDVIKVKGPKYGIEKNEIFKQASLMIFPTAWPNEAFPIVILEAMNAGLPIISTPEGGIPDQIIEGQNGYLIPKDDHEEIAKKTALLLSDSDLQRTISNNNKKIFYEKYTLKHFENNVLEVFNVVINKEV